MLIENHYGFAGNSTRVISGADETRFIALEASNDAAYWVQWTLHAPITESYILLPACAYDANRFEIVMRRYPPRFTEAEIALNPPIRTTQFPHLSKDGNSFMDVTTGDLSTPCVCVLNKAKKTAFMVFFNQCANGLNHGITLEQEGENLHIILRAPAKRRLVYRWYDGYPSLRENPEADAPLCVSTGDETVVTHHTFTFPCEDIPALYKSFFEKRALCYHAEPNPCLPFSAFWDMAEKEHNEKHYIDRLGLYCHRAESCFKPGWVGGGMNTLAFITDGNEVGLERAIRSLEFPARHQSPKGFYYGAVRTSDEVLLHEAYETYAGKYSLQLIRKQGDMTYFMFKQIALLMEKGVSVPDVLVQSGIRAADALVTLWRKYGQLGHFVNADTGEIISGGSTSGAMAVAALCAAARITENRTYLETAHEIGRFFYRTATQAGLTTGGPAEAMQSPDSESSAALFEGLVALYEEDGTEEWLSMACDAAHQLASWVVSYDYKFPPESKFGKRGVHTAGSVWANLQNKHSSPGLCTLSASSFLKLYRATGNENYLRVMREISHFIPQVASRPDSPVYNGAGHPLDPSDMCERVNLSDWEGNHNIGDSIFGPSAWPHAAMMLTYAEIPGIYLVPSRNVLCVSDHVNAYFEDGMLTIENPTAYPARVKVMVDTEETLLQPLHLAWQKRFCLVSVESGQTATIRI